MLSSKFFLNFLKRNSQNAFLVDKMGIFNIELINALCNKNDSE